MEKELDYRKVICIMIDLGYITCDQAIEAVQLHKNQMQKEVKSGPSWEVARRLMAYLNACIIQNGRKPSRVNDTAIGVMEKLHRIDKHSEEEIMEMIAWCQSHDFWSTVVLSPEKVRKNWQQMSGQRERDGHKVAQEFVPVPKVAPIDNDYMKEMERRRSESVPMPKGFKEALRKAL